MIETQAEPASADGTGASVAALLRRSGTACGVAVIEGSRVTWSGTSNSRPGTLFQAGSIAKPVAALAALELTARGRLDLDGDVNEQLTSWRLPGRGVISLRQLLGHTSGTCVPFFPGYPQGAAVPTLRQVLDGEPPAATRPVRAEPAGRHAFRYSGGGYAVIQQLICDVTGMPFAQAAQSLVLEPLGMTESTFAQPLPDGLRPLAARRDWRVYPECAAAGFWTTPRDLARYACALQAALAGHPSAVRATVAAQILTPRTPLTGGGEWNLLPLAGIRPPDSFGLGMFLHGGDRFSHYGGAAGFFAALTGSASDGTGAVVMTASNGALPAFRLLRAISAEYRWSGFRQPAWRRLHGLPGIRNFARSAAASP